MSNWWICWTIPFWGRIIILCKGPRLSPTHLLNLPMLTWHIMDTQLSYRLTELFLPIETMLGREKNLRFPASKVFFSEFRAPFLFSYWEREKKSKNGYGGATRILKVSLNCFISSAVNWSNPPLWSTHNLSIDSSWEPHSSANLQCQRTQIKDI